MPTVEALIQQLQSDDYYDRCTAARGLGDAQDPRATQALMATLTSDTDDWVLEYAAESLGRLGDPAAIPALVALLDHKHYKVRTAAAGALGVLGNPDALPALRKHAEDSDTWVREAVEEAIRDIEGGTPATPDYAAPDAPQPTPAPTAPAGRPPTRMATEAPANPDEMVVLAAKTVGAQYKRLKDGSHLLRLTLANARRQKVRIITNETTSTGAGRIRLITVIAPAATKVVAWAMRQNLHITRGAIGALRLRGRDYLALTEALLTADVTTSVLEDAIERLAERGDRLERIMTKQDKW